MPVTSTDLAPIDQIRGLVNQKKPALEGVLPKHLTVQKFIGVAMRLVQADDKLLKSDPASIYMALHQAAQFGLEVDGILGQAYLVPYWSKERGCYIATFQIGYRGLIYLAANTGAVSYIDSDAVREADYFSYSKGAKPVLEHTKELRKPRGQMYAVWASCKLKDGNTPFVVLTVEDIERIKQSAKAAAGPWQTHEEEMWRKSAIRRLCKSLPMSADMRDLVRAAVLDEYNEQGITIPGEMDESKPALPAAPKEVPVMTEAASASLRQKLVAAQTTPAPTPAAAKEPDPFFLEVDGKKLIRGTVTSILREKTTKGGAIEFRLFMSKTCLSTFNQQMFPPLKTTLNQMCIFAYSIGSPSGYMNISDIRRIGETEYENNIPVEVLEEEKDKKKGGEKEMEGVWEDEDQDTISPNLDFS